MSAKPNVDQLKVVADFLWMQWECGDFEHLQETGFDGIIEAMPLVLAWLDSQIVSKKRRLHVNDVKRKYAAEHGLSYRQVRIKKSD